MKSSLTRIAAAVPGFLGRVLRRLFNGLRPPWTRSGVACMTLLVLNYLSMGMLGLLLYYLAYPLYYPFFGNINDWHGEEVWPAAVVVGMAWPFSFLLARNVQRRLASRGAGTAARRLAYVGVVWLSAVLLWGWMLLTMDGVRFAA